MVGTPAWDNSAADEPAHLFSRPNLSFKCMMIVAADRHEGRGAVGSIAATARRTARIHRNLPTCCVALGASLPKSSASASENGKMLFLPNF
jgi:hypothetical protein